LSKSGPAGTATEVGGLPGLRICRVFLGFLSGFNYPFNSFASTLYPGFSGFLIILFLPGSGSFGNHAGGIPNLTDSSISDGWLKTFYDGGKVLIFGKMRAELLRLQIAETGLNQGRGAVLSSYRSADRSGGGGFSGGGHAYSGGGHAYSRGHEGWGGGRSYSYRGAAMSATNTAIAAVRRLRMPSSADFRSVRRMRGTELRYVKTPARVNHPCRGGAEGALNRPAE
jgi:hypothetical protein